MRGLIRLIIIFLALVQSLLFWKNKKIEPKKILIAHNLLLGDTLLLAPLMKRVQEKYPNAKKFILTKSTFLPFFKNAPYGFNALSFNPKSFLDLIKIFFAGPYDQAFVIGDNRYSWLARALGSCWSIGISGDKPHWKNWMIDEVKPFDESPATWADMLGRIVDGKNPKPYQKNEWVRPAAKKLSFSLDIAKPYIVCHLGASNPLRFWPYISWQILIQDIKAKGFEVVLSVGPGEEYLIDEVDPSKSYHHVRGTFSLIEMWSLIENSKLLISSDTGMAHLAKVASIPTITLYGPGSPLIHDGGQFWKNSLHQSITINPYPCRDQNSFFRREVLWLKRCTRNIYQCKTPGACMNVISPKHVINSLNAIFKKI
jgi:ADP-heptose:LPS heptosyltransferase